MRGTGFLPPAIHYFFNGIHHSFDIFTAATQYITQLFKLLCPSYQLRITLSDNLQQLLFTALTHY